MNFNIEDFKILEVISGSHAYGTNIETSDIDTKGVCIPPLEYHFGYLQKFEEHHTKIPDSVIYSLKKFTQLAVDCNPNIIEVLHVNDSDILSINEFGSRLLNHRDLFISKKAKHTFSGYMMSQVKRIKTHRGWLLNPPKEPPKRKDFGLPENMKVTKTELGCFEAIENQGMKDLLNANIIEIFTQEKKYQSLLTQWNQYQEWKQNRNPVRAAMEAMFGFDGKHGLHTIRLGRMCCEILSGQGVIVRRPDAEELLGIRRGEWSYERLLEEAECLDKKSEELYETSTLPHQPDRVKIDNIIVEMTQMFLEMK